MPKKNLPNQRITRIGEVEYVPAPNLEGVPVLTVPGPDDDRLAKVRERNGRPRPPITSWIDGQGSLVVQDSLAGTKTLTRKCPECNRWFKLVRAAAGRARWPKTCSDPCKASSQRKVDAERKRRQRERDKMPHKYTFDTIDCDLYSEYLPRYLSNNRVSVIDGVVHKILSPEAQAQAEAYIAAQEEWESWAQR